MDKVNDVGGGIVAPQGPSVQCSSGSILIGNASRRIECCRAALSNAWSHHCASLLPRIFRTLETLSGQGLFTLKDVSRWRAFRGMAYCLFRTCAIASEQEYWHGQDLLKLTANS